MDDIIRIVESLENSSVLVDRFSETVKHEIKKQERRFLSMLLRLLGASVLGNILPGKGVQRTRKGVLRAERRYNNLDNIFGSAPSFKEYRDY